MTFLKLAATVSLIAALASAAEPDPQQILKNDIRVHSISVTVIDPNAESPYAITPARFDERTAAQLPLVVTDEARIQTIAAIVKRVSCRKSESGSDLRYRWEITHRSGGDPVVIYASRHGDIFSHGQYWRCADPGWLGEAWAVAGGRADRAPGYVPITTSIPSAPAPTGQAGRRLHLAIVLAGVFVLVLCAATVGRFRRSRRKES